MDSQNEIQLKSSLTKLPSLSDIEARKIKEKEIREALDVLNISIRKYNNALRIIGSASNWSNYDTFGGGGIISSSIKHDKIKEGNRALKEANESLVNVSKELADVPEIANIKISDDQKAFDIFFDNIFTDYDVKKKIDKAEKNCWKTLNHLKSLEKELNYLLESVRIKSREEIEKDNNAAIVASDNAIMHIEKAINSIDKAYKSIDADKGIFRKGLNYLLDNKEFKIKEKIMNAVKGIKNINEKLKYVQGFDTTLVNELNKYKANLEVFSRMNILAKKKEKTNLTEAKNCCLDTIKHLEIIKKALNDVILKCKIEC
ncbi:hypothetical protein PIROE2DRAFT_67067 [Piromyces sp. E2]|nr:hypothetical protein PIROE2DRAFT_67067 [Piromyces sp. E2]|eukprot:OUM67053.1 hypothetical protein PIROE2DRAFT_67067 [Piromyces sp. E2]